MVSCAMCVCVVVVERVPVVIVLVSYGYFNLNASCPDSYLYKECSSPWFGYTLLLPFISVYVCMWTHYCHVLLWRKLEIVYSSSLVS